MLPKLSGYQLRSVTDQTTINQYLMVHLAYIGRKECQIDENPKNKLSTIALFRHYFDIQVMVSKEPRWVPAEVIVPRDSLQQLDATTV